MGRNIGDILIELGFVNQSDVKRAAEMQKAEGYTRRLGQILKDMVIKDEMLLQALSVQFGMPMLTEEQVPEVLPIDRVSFDFLKRHRILPLALEGRTLSVAVADPTATDPIETLRATFDYEIAPTIGDEGMILAAIERLEASKDTVMQKLLEGVGEEASSLTDEMLGELSHLKDMAQEKGIIKLVNMIVEGAIHEGASDIHIEPAESEMRVRYRIDGILYERELLPVKTQAAVASRVKLLAQMNIAERRLPQDGRIKGRFGGKNVDIRVSTLPTVYGESIVMRLLDREMSVLSLEDIGFDRELLSTYEALIRKPHGMFLITGPTGSGKTTTLYASLDKINSQAVKIITIEEPVEYLLKGINQIQVRPKVGLTFASGLRSIVRQDPDIIMVGEIRDIETAGISIHAALTGHFLFSTLHTNDAASAVTRLIDMGVEHYLVASTLVGVMAQRLVRRICPHCAEEYAAPAEIVREFGERLATLRRGRGCDSCMGTGYRGRISIFELLIVNDGIRDLIMREATAREIMQRAVSEGMRTLRDDGLRKVLQGITTIEEVFRVTQAEVAY
jgi:type II secretion system protein E